MVESCVVDMPRERSVEQIVSEALPSWGHFGAQLRFARLQWRRRSGLGLPPHLGAYVEREGPPAWLLPAALPTCRWAGASP